MSNRFSRGLVTTLMCLSFLTAGVTSASAGDDVDANGPTGNSTTTGDGTTYTAHVDYVHRGTGDGDNPQPVRSSNANFSPPVCWYTAMTPEQMKAEIMARFYKAGHDGSGTTYNFYNDQNNEMDGYKYNEGKDGNWWVLTWDEVQMNQPNHGFCPYDDGYFWRPPANPPAGQITPKMLADAAYGQMKLPSKGVDLSPAPENQKVNLPTYVKFQRANAQVSVTAQLTEPNGQVLAATVTAVPQSLTVQAGTQYARPGSCEYDLGGAAALNSAGAGCNVTYLKASAGTYPFTADMTWRVWWTPTANSQPNGTAMDAGFSEFQQDVTVQEIQAVNR
ncbi:hypothetical protein [Streptomyces sp. NPDC008139]|uniref:hypothetical protein n=1 Tax=Streptomyces sp. NPDC008139 TaxID=3364814 RepID=UPI0036EACF21